MKEKLQEYALIAEIISAIAVVAGLVFVGLQIRQSTEQNALNTRALEAAAYQDLIGQILEINTTALADKELAELVVRIFERDLSAVDEDPRVFVLLQTLGRHADMACFQYQKGLISKERLGSAMAIYLALVYRPFGRDHPTVQGLMNTTPGFGECIDIIESLAGISAPNGLSAETP